MSDYEKCLSKHPDHAAVCTRPRGHYGQHQAWDHVYDKPLGWADRAEAFDSQNWTPYGDSRTNAELKAKWEELGRSDPRTQEEAKEIMYRQDLIDFTLTMRKWHHIGDDWVHPRRDDPRWKDSHGAA